MKKGLWKTIAIGLCLALIAGILPLVSACGTQGPTAEKPLILDYASYLPETYPGSKPSMEFFKEIENVTKGAVKTNFHWVQQMGPGKDNYDMTVKGIADAAIISPSYTPGIMPMWAVFNMPTNTSSAELFTKAMIEVFKTGVFDKEFGDVKMISIYALPAYQLASKDRQVAKLSDFAGLKIRVNGEHMSDGIKALGGTPIFHSGGDAYSNLQKGVTDAVMWPWDGIVASYHLDEICGSITETSIFSDGMTEAMNKDTFKSLPKAAQDYINNNWDKYSIQVAANFDKIAASSRESYVKTGKPLLKLDPSERAKMDQLFAPVWQKFFNDMKSQGFDGEAVAKLFYQKLTALGVQNPFIGYTPK
jgi:TRAP-type transport system periplasmic protein